MDEIRPLSTDIDLLPRTHGSALFTRGETQALATTTLGSLEENQILDGLTLEDIARVGEVTLPEGIDKKAVNQSHQQENHRKQKAEKLCFFH